MSARLGLSLVLAVSLFTSFSAAPALAAEWKLVDQQEKGYFVPLDEIQKRSNSKKTRSEPAGKSKVKRNEAARTVREYGTPRKAYSKEDVPGARSLESKVEGRFHNTYEVWPVVTYDVTTTTTPYVDYEIRDWQEATKDHFKNTYEITEELSWVEPVTGDLKSFTRKHTEGPVEETVQGPWADQTSKTEKGRANDVQVGKKEAATRRESRKVRSVRAAGAGSSVDPNLVAPGGVGFAAEAGKGGSTARVSSYRQGLGLSGAAKARSVGLKAEFDFDALLTLAARGPDLYDDGAAKPAWKLEADRGAVVFTPYDAAGQLDTDSRVVLGKGERRGSGAKGAIVSVESVSASPAALLGQFKAPKGRQSGRLSVR